MDRGVGCGGSTLQHVYLLAMLMTCTASCRLDGHDVIIKPVSVEGCLPSLQPNQLRQIHNKFRLGELSTPMVVRWSKDLEICWICIPDLKVADSSSLVLSVADSSV